MKRFILIIICELCYTGMQAQINHSTTFDLSKLAIENQIQEDGNAYANVSYENCVVNDSVGAPSLPYQILRFIVPNEPVSFSVDVNASEGEVVNLTSPILPVQQPIPTSTTWTKNEFTPISASSSGMYPQEIVQIIGEDYLDGDKRILTVKVAPMQYAGSSNQLFFHSSVDFTINYHSALGRVAIKRAVSPIASPSRSDTELADMLDFVENKSDISKFISKNQQIRSITLALNLPSYEYVVITSESLVPYFKRLIDWKRQKGLNAGIVTMQQILNDLTIKKDEASNISDDAGKLRQYLRLAYQHGTKYVLLGGGRMVVPIRYGGMGYSNIPYEYIPTDLYFSELNGNWNKDGDVFYGELYGDAVEYDPELYVGRLLCKNGQEVDNYLDKLLLYEQNPGKGDYGYLKKALYLQSDQLQRNHEGDTIASDFKNIFSDYSIIEEFPDHQDSFPIYPTGKEVIDFMKRKHHGFMSWFGHGSPNGINTKACGVNDSLRYNIIAVEGQYTSGVVKEQGNGLNNLVNYDHPAIVYAISCDVVPYDIFTSGSITYDLKYNVGESCTVGGKYGFAAFLGNTRSGYIGWSTQLERIFIDKIKNDSPKIGIAEARSKANYKGGNKHQLALTHNLIGCPEFEMWTDIPSKFVNVLVAKSPTSLTVNAGVANTKIALRGLFNDNRSVCQTGRTATFPNLPKNYIVTLYQHNYIPYVTPIYLQNESVTGKHNIKGGQISMGSAVDNSKANGDFVIKSGADLVLEVSDGITLDAGTTIEAGACFEIKLAN